MMLSGSSVATAFGAVVVLGADHRVIGILSERDIVWAL
jgi:CBS domain-containing protein